MYKHSDHPFFRLQSADGLTTASYVHTGVFSRLVDECYNLYASGDTIDISISRFETDDAIAFIMYDDGVPTHYTEVTRLQLVTDQREKRAMHVIESCHEELSPESLRAIILSPDNQLPK